VGFATLTSASSWHTTNQTTADETQEYIKLSVLPEPLRPGPRTLIVGREALDDRPLTQELRLASKGVPIRLGDRTVLQ